MRALRLHGPEDARLDDVPEPVAGHGEVLIDVHHAGLCGSDLHAYVDGPASGLGGVTLPLILGHEASGVVAGLGGGVDDVEVGARVAIFPIETCGACPRCHAGFAHLCRKIAFHGLHRAGGGLSERTTVRRDMIHVLPDGVSDLHGALVEPMAVAAHAAGRTGATAGETVLVVGAGPIGLGALLALRAKGIKAVISDPSAVRRDAARRLGADVVLDPGADDVPAAVRDLTGGLGAAGAVEAAGVGPALTTSLRALRPDATAVIVSMHTALLSFPAGLLVRNEVALTGSMIYSRREFDEVIAAMAGGAYPLDGWVETISLGSVLDGLQRMRAQRANKLVVAIQAGA